MTRIEQGIEDIEDYLAGCKGTVFTGANRVVVERDKMEELLAELRNRIPDEIKKYQKIVASKDSILAEAKEQAAQIVENARNQAAQISSEHEIMLQAEDKANAMIEQAERQAREAVDSANLQHNEICEGAIDYADKMLASMLTVIRNAMDGADANFAAYMNNMRANYEIVESNLKELRGTDSEPVTQSSGGYRGGASQTAGYGSQSTGYGSQSTGYGYGRSAESGRIAGGSASDNYFGRETVGHFTDDDVPEDDYEDAPEDGYEEDYEDSYEEQEENQADPRSIYASSEENAAAYASYEANASARESYEEEEGDSYSDPDYPEDSYADADEEYDDVPDGEDEAEEMSEEDRLEEEFARPEPKAPTGYRPTYEDRTTPLKKEPASPEIYGESKNSRSGSGRSNGGRRGKRR